MDITLSAEKRDTSIKGYQLRKKGFVPACVYGKNMESLPIQIDSIELNKCIKAGAVKLKLKVGRTSYLASIEEVQKNCVGTEYYHIAFHTFDANEKVSMHVPIHFSGKALGQTSGGVLQQQLSEVTLYGMAKDLPDELLVDVTNLEVGHSIHISDLPKNSKWEIKDSSDKVIVACNYSKLQFEEESSVSPEDVVEPPLVSSDDKKEAA